MRRSGAMVQQTVFAALENDRLLVNGLTSSDRSDLGKLGNLQIAFDGMTSQWRNQPSGLVFHRLRFSIWGPLAGFADIDGMAVRLENVMQRLTLPDSLQLVRASLLLAESRLDTQSRQWRQELSFGLVTQADETST